jgi:hypothetical protein
MRGFCTVGLCEADGWGGEGSVSSRRSFGRHGVVVVVDGHVVGRFLYAAFDDVQRKAEGGEGWAS